jgi:hypothetical protein
MTQYRSPEYRLKQSIVQKERCRLHPDTEETKRKKSEGIKRHYQEHPMTEEHKKNLAKSHIGKQTWLGRHHTEETKKELSILTHNQMLGNKHTLGHRLTEEHKQRIREGCKGINTGKRPPFSEEWRKKLGDASRGKKRPFTVEHKQHLALVHKELWNRQRVSKPQKELFELLKQVFPDATLELPIKTLYTYRFADIGIPSIKFDFEYDGEFWHKKERLLKDADRDKELAQVGWATFRINSSILKELSEQKITLTELIKK